MIIADFVQICIGFSFLKYTDVIVNLNLAFAYFLHKYASNGLFLIWTSMGEHNQVLGLLNSTLQSGFQGRRAKQYL